jgi:hypothetical protein
MEKQAWIPEVFKWVGMLLIGISLIIFSIRRSRKKIDDAVALKSKNNHHPYAKELSELQLGETIIIIDINDEGKPICELTDEFAFQLPMQQRNFFILHNVEKFNLQEGKTYEVGKSADGEELNLSQVAMMF